ncbi:MAG TPA: ankyrin repeat domain-containing protein [Vicinamibacterales bacterium]|nr:ankyrin repeat domain-containing protein [Vicinamibacterales bacterium]
MSGFSRTFMRIAVVGLALVLSAPVVAQQRDLRLLDAVKRRDQKTFNSLIRAKADVNAAQPDGATALAWAVYLGQRSMAEALLDVGANANTVDEYGETPVTLAAANGDGALVQRLLKAGAKATAARWNGETALMIAAGAGSVESVRHLVLHGADVNAADPRRGQTALMWAAAEGHADVVSALLEIGADPKAVSKNGFNALAFAIAKNDASSARSLIAAGLDPNFLLPSGNRLLMVAMAYGHTEAASVLLEAGADIRATDRAGSTALHAAAQAGNLVLVKQLLDKGADPNVRTAQIAMSAARGGGGGGRTLVGGALTPLMIAARANQLEVMKMLVAAGADPKLRADHGTTTLMYAAAAKLPTVTYAYEIDPNVDVVNQAGQTPMHASVSGGTQRTQDEIVEVIQFLADKGAKLDELDAAGRTAISLADTSPIDKAVDLLTALILKSGSTPKIPSKR